MSDLAISGVEYFKSLAKLEGIKLTSLEAACRLLDLLGNPQDKIPAVHVAGTNGKGTVCAILAAILFSTGKSVGQTSSPHLVDVCERCLVNGWPASPQDFGQAVEAVVSVARQAELSPSYFVLGIAAAFYHFAHLKLDWTVVEVGLGGRFDATNALKQPRVSVITNIDYDHTELLGKSLQEIAANKAGIIRKSVPVFVGEMPLEAQSEIEKIAATVDAPIECFGRDFYYDSEISALVINGNQLPLSLKNFSLQGAHQLKNAILAARIALHLGLSQEAIEAGLARVRWPGRLERFQTARETEQVSEVLLDVAHNPAGILVLVDCLKSLLSQKEKRFKRLTFVLSILETKDWSAMLRLLEEAAEIFLRDFEVETKYVFTSSGNSRAVSPEVLREQISNGVALNDCEEAFRWALEDADSDTLVVVTGSVYLVGKIRPLIDDRPIRTIV